MTNSSAALIGVALLVNAVASPAAGAAAPGQVCASAKVEAAGKKVACKAGCDSIAVRANASPNDACLRRCDHLSLTKTGGRAGCGSSGDLTALDGKVDALRDELHAALGLGGPSRCTAGKYKLSGKTARCGLRCRSKAIVSGAPVDAGCRQVCALAFSRECDLAERNADCIRAMACSSLASAIDAFVADVTGRAPDPTSTTLASTTSTTSSTTTSTTICVATSGTFCDLGNGTIHDSATGLQWEKKDGVDAGTPNPADPHDVDNRYTWAGRCTSNTAKLCQPTAGAAARCRAQTPDVIAATGGCGQCAGDDGTCGVDPHGAGAITTVWEWLDGLNATGFGGHGDWRLPTTPGGEGCYGSATEPAELESTWNAAQCLDCSGGSGDGGGCIDPIFAPTMPLNYWTAATFGATVVPPYVDYPEYACVVLFRCPFVQSGAKDVPAFVRAVRTAP